MDVVSFDANILFSAAYRPDTGLRSLPGVQRITSVYAEEEARRNLGRPKQREELEELLGSVEVIATAPFAGHPLFSKIELPDKDQPILLAAIGAGAPHLPTGDFQHFGPYYRETIEEVLILSPGDYLSSRTG